MTAPAALDDALASRAAHRSAVSPHPRVAGVLVLIALVASACGTTTHGATTAGDAGLAPESAALSEQPTGDGSTAAAAGASSRTAGAVKTRDQTSATFNPPVAANGPLGVGVTKTAVTVGAFELKNAAQFLAAFGVRGNAGLNYRTAQNAIVSYINAHGGLGGRTATAVYHALDATSTDTYAAIAQAACSDFTEDHSVFAVIGAPLEMVPCLAQHGTVALNNADQAGDEQFLMKTAATYYTPSSLGYERKAAAWVDGLAQLGFLGAGKFGLLYYDVAGMPSSVSSTLRPAMANHGIKFTSEIEIPFPQSTSGAASTVAAIQSAVLRFKTDGIDHVMLYDVNGTMPTFFMKEADSQGYRPRYALNSDSHLEFTNVNVPHAQLHNALAVGWRPQEDITAAKPANAQEVLCRQIMSKAGVDLPDVGTAATAITLCDMWFALKAGLDRAPWPDARGFRTGIESLGTSWVSPRTYATRFASDRTHDGVAAVHGVAYRDQCNCWVDAGSVQRID